MDAVPTLLQHGALGAIIVLQSALIYYLLGRIRELTDKMLDIATKQDAVLEHIQNGK